MLCTAESSKVYKPLIAKESLRVENTVNERETSVKDLGLTVHHRLNWTEHISNKVEAARRMLFRLKGFIGKTWGPNPNMVRYAYTACVSILMVSAHHEKKVHKYLGFSQIGSFMFIVKTSFLD